MPHDLLRLDDLSEEKLVAALVDRFVRRRHMYTSVGTILIAINPYEWRPEMYTPEVMRRYCSSTSASAPLEPHLYQTAQMVHETLVSGAAGPRQTIIISGESGAGKTESTKLILTYLVDAAGPAAESGDGRLKLRERVLSANPLLEAFGNAKTLRNDNSSRFGKLVEIHFRRPSGFRAAPEIAGARIVNYLLERTRLSRPPTGERNFHILYQLLASPAGNKANDERAASLLSVLPIGQPERLHYLSAEQPWSVAEAAAEAAAFGATTATLQALGVSADEREQLWTLLTAVLLLGNLTFAPQGTNGCSLSDTAAQESLANLLCVTPAALTAALCMRKLNVRQQQFHRPQSESQAKDARDALGRALYNGCFEWLVHKLNQTIRPKQIDGDAKGAESSCVGILDIYGFESLASNSFEQLLINFANEKLQRLFNIHIFELEQEEYKKEGIKWREVTWKDNQSTLDLIEGRPNGVPGILYALDDASWRASEDDSADSKYINELNTAFGSKDATSHPAYVRPRFGDSSSFVLLHYAGEVTYDVRGFARKNTETLTPDAQELLHASTNAWLVANRHFVLRSDPSLGSAPAPTPLLSSSSSSTNSPRKGDGSTRPLKEKNGALESRPPVVEKRGSKLRQASVGEQFRSQLQELIAVIDPNATATSPTTKREHERSACAYVRCIKSNDVRAAWQLDEPSLTHQLRCAGMMEAVRIRRETFAQRHTHSAFLSKFRALPISRAASAKLAKASGTSDAKAVVALAAGLVTALNEPKAAWQCGSSKIFVRDPLAHRLARWSDVRRTAAYGSIERAVRARANRRRHSAACALQRAWTLRRATIQGRAHRVVTRLVANGLARWRRHVKRAQLVTARRVALPLLQRSVRKWIRSRARARKEAMAASKAPAPATVATTAALQPEQIVSPPRFLGMGGAPVFARASAYMGAPPAPMVPEVSSPPDLIRAITVEEHPPTAQPPSERAPSPASDIIPLAHLPSAELQRAVQVANPPAQANVAALAPAPAKAAAPARHTRSIVQLGPRKALCVGGGVSIASVAAQMLSSRSEAVLIVGDGDAPIVAARPKVDGILTATDIARRVVAAGRCPSKCTASEVMTRNPHTVRDSDAADDALSVMISGSFRHVPVLTAEGPPLVLDLVRCLFDVIAMLERAQAAGEALIDAVSRQAGATSGGGGTEDILAPALSTLLAPSLLSLATSCERPHVVSADAPPEEAARAMLAPGVTAVLVKQPDERYELITPRALLRAVAEGSAAVSGVGALSKEESLPLTPPVDCSVLDALHLLQAERLTHTLLLPQAAGEDADPLALLDMLQLVRASITHAERSADAQQLNAFLGAAAALSEVGTAPPANAHGRTDEHPGRGGLRGIAESPRAFGGDDEADRLSEARQSTLGSELSFARQGTLIDDSMTSVSCSQTEVRPEDSISMVGVSLGATNGHLGSAQFVAEAPAAGFEHVAGGTTGLLIKLKDTSGNMHRVRCDPSDGWAALRSKIEAKAPDAAQAQLTYMDEDGDQAAIDSDEALQDAAAQAYRSGGRLAVTVVAAGTALQSAGTRKIDKSASTPSALTQRRWSHERPPENLSAVSSFLGGLIAASSLAVGAGLVLAAKAAKR